MLSLAIRTAGGLVAVVLWSLVFAAPVISADPPAKDAKALAPATAAPSIPAKAEEKEVELEAEVDVAKLLKRDLVFPQPATMTDGIWQVAPVEGRMVMRVPFKIAKPSAETVVSGASVKVRGGRFICWQLIDPTEEEKGVTPAAPTTQITATGSEALPVGVPRMTRSFRLATDGTIHWKLDRAIPGAKVIETGTGPYTMKLSPAALEKLNPGNAPRILKNAGESPADFAKRKAPLEEEYRRKAAAYRELKLSMLKLPDEFSGPMPPAVWAIYETRANPKTLELDGPAPLPWEFPFDLLLQLQRLVAPGGTETSTVAATPLDDILSKVLSDPKVHPLSLRLITFALTNSNYLEKMEEGDAKFALLDKVLAGKDTIATAELMKYLAVRPGKASASLMKKAIVAGLLDAKAQLSSIAGMIDTFNKNPAAGIDSAVLTISEYLADPKGPSAKDALKPLFDLAAKNTSAGTDIVKSIRIEATDARRDEVIITLLESAATDPTAAAIVDAKLLGAEDASIKERTLYLLSQAVRSKMDLNSFKDVEGKPIALVTPQTKLVVVEFWAGWCPPCVAGAPKLVEFEKTYRPQGVAMLGINRDKTRAEFEAALKDLKFTWPQVHDDAEKSLLAQWAVTSIPHVFVLSPDGQMLWRGHAELLEQTVAGLLASKPETTAAVTGPRPVLIDDIPIRDVSDSIFRLLTDSKLRNLAWGALKSMKMARTDQGSNERRRWPQLIVDLAIAQSPTPVASARFIAKHREDNVTEALVQLVNRADADASVHAAKSLLGSNLPLEQVLPKLGSESDRHSFGIRFYENIVREAPYSVGLLRDKSDSSKVVAWFGKQVAGGTLPDPAKWVRAYGTPERVMELVVVSDNDLAMGAVGAVVAAAGGDGQDTADVGQKLRANKNATVPEVIKLWAPLAKEIFAKKLKGTSGAYRLSYRVGNVSKEGDVTWGGAVPAGEVTMKVEGGNVAMNKVTAMVAADDSLTLQLKPADLLQLTQQTAALTADSKDKSIVIQPNGPAGWYAEFSLADGRRVELSLEK